MLFCDTQECLEGVDFFLINFSNYTSEHNTKSHKGGNSDNKHNDFSVYEDGDLAKDISLSLLDFLIHEIPCDVSIDFEVINLKLLDTIVGLNKLLLSCFILQG